MKRWVWRAFKALGLLLLLVALTALAVGWRSFGHRAAGTRRARMEQSLQWHDGSFVNPQPIVNSVRETVQAMWHPDANVSPHAPLPTVRPQLETPPASGLRVTWFGHSSTLVEIDGQRALIDPVWSERPTPILGLGPHRWFPPPLPLDALPKIDVVLISHDHYDHLDRPTVVALAKRGVRFVVPLGVAAHLVYWGVPESQIHELDWWQRARIGELQVVSTPARHASGRQVLDRDATLWTGYALLGARHRVYYSGDTGLFPAMRTIGERLGPFDLTMIEVGQYNRGWPDWHIGPEQAVRAHQWVKGRVMLPVHWGLFALAFHGWTEPIERALAAATAEGVKIVAPRPGQSFEPATPPAVERWWPSLPWHTAKENPIVSSQVE